MEPAVQVLSDSGDGRSAAPEADMTVGPHEVLGRPFDPEPRERFTGTVDQHIVQVGSGPARPAVCEVSDAQQARKGAGKLCDLTLIPCVDRPAQQQTELRTA
jgi:hypothetical protein